INGSNHYPQDIELTVESCHPALQPAGGAAFSVTENGKEQLVIVQEVTRQSRKADINELTSAIRQEVAEKHDLRAFAIVLIKPMSILKTSSGKIQRRATKTAFLENKLEVIGEWRAKPLTPKKDSTQKIDFPINASDKKTSTEIQAWLIERISSMLEMDKSSIDPRQ